jgi:hypothetical protein
MSSAEVIKAIQEQKNAAEGEEIEEINLDSIQISKFTNEINKELAVSTLYSLSLNDCGIISLDNFPKLPSLIRLELMDNKIAASTLGSLGKSCPNLQSLSLGGNPIKEYDELKNIQNLTQLYQLDLIKCDICSKPDYRAKIFEMFPSLQILDNFTQDGEPYDYDEEEGEEDDDAEGGEEEEDNYNPEEEDDDEDEAAVEDESDDDDEEIEEKATKKKKPRI